MKPDTRHLSGLLLIAATVVALASAGTTSAGSTFSDAAIKRAIPRGAAAEGATERVDSSEKRAFSVMKKIYKDIQRRSCRQTPRPAPTTSWPARGENAIAICS